MINTLQLKSIAIAGDFNVHNPNWLVFSSQPDTPGLYTELFCCYNSLTQLVSEPTHYPRTTNQRFYLLDLFLTSGPLKYNVKVNTPLRNSDHCLVKALYSISPTTSNHASNVRTLWHYASARWNDINNFFLNFNWSVCFLDDVNSAVEAVTKTILLGMLKFIPSTKKKFLARAKHGLHLHQVDAKKINILRFSKRIHQP